LPWASDGQGKSSPGLVTSRAIDIASQLPSIKVPEPRDYRLRSFGSGDEEICTRCGGEAEKLGDDIGGGVDSGEEERMDGRPQLMPPFPGYPSPLIFTKCDLPGRLKGLKKFIGLEKGANGKCVYQPKSD
jgi:hypothetical protein